MDTQFIGLRGLAMDSTIKHSLLLTNFLDYWGLSYDHKHSALYIKTRKLCSVIWLLKTREGMKLMQLQCHPPDCFVFEKVRKQANRKLEYCLCFYTLRSIKNKGCVSRSMDGHWFLYPKTQVKRLSIMTLNDISIEFRAEIDTWLF